MSFTVDHRQKFMDLDTQIGKQDYITRQANGGNSILFCYPPNEENLYINKATELYSDRAEFIDVSALLVQFIDKEGWKKFSNYYKDYSNTPEVVFKSDDPDQDLFDMIITSIERVGKKDKIPFLIRTGCLYGTGIENASVMENNIVIRHKYPLVIFYPSRISDNKIDFLNIKPSNTYRCILIK